MRKRTVPVLPDKAIAPAPDWLPIASLAQAELTSENPEKPFESVLTPDEESGWQAAEGGPQRIRLLFDEPVTLSRIYLVFEEAEMARTQEFVLSWGADAGAPLREVVRQQYTFSPPGTTRQVEEYTVQLAQLTVLELMIVPAIGGGSARASLKQLRLA